MFFVSVRAVFVQVATLQWAYYLSKKNSAKILERFVCSKANFSELGTGQRA